MPLLSTIGGTPPATLGSNGYYCASCAHRVRLEHTIAPPTCVLAQIALAQIWRIGLLLRNCCPVSLTQFDSVIANSLRAGTGGKYKA
eukprot:scaffold19910_cov70-Phaeocystis_antarctica.AAC.2